MPKFGSTSRERLATCHVQLQQLFNAVIEEYDCTVLCGHRNQEEQDTAFFGNPQRSKLRWPNGKHNKKPSIAVDVAPWPIRWEDKFSFTISADMFRGLQSRWEYRCGGGVHGTGTLTSRTKHSTTFPLRVAIMKGFWETQVTAWYGVAAAVLGGLLWIFKLHSQMSVLQGQVKQVQDDVRYLRNRIDQHFDGGD